MDRGKVIHVCACVYVCIHVYVCLHVYVCVCVNPVRPRWQVYLHKQQAAAAWISLPLCLELAAGIVLGACSLWTGTAHVHANFHLICAAACQLWTGTDEMEVSTHMDCAGRNLQSFLQSLEQ